MTYKEVKDLIGFEGDLLIEEGVEHSTQIKQILLGREAIQLH